MGHAAERIDPYVALHLRAAAQAGAAVLNNFVAHATTESIEAIRAMPNVSVRSMRALAPGLQNLELSTDRLGQGQLSEMPGVRRLVTTTRAPQLPVLLQLRHQDWDRDIAGMTRGSRLGPFLTALVDAAALEVLAHDPDIVSVEASRGGAADCVHSMPAIRADQAHAPPLSERGAGALVAVIDEGIDVLHAAFHDTNGHTRILYVWDQNDPTGPAPAAVDPAFKEQGYGTLHTQAAIDAMITANDTLSLGRDPGLHGTHVASIAAGSPVASTSFPGGVAPEAAIVFVIPKLQAGTGDPHSLGYSVSHIDALAFIRAAAEKLDTPVAVNVSLGQNAGGHDGMSPLELAFDAFCGGGRTPGFVTVKSAGNEFGFNGHTYVQAFEGALISIEWTTDQQPRAEDYLEFWYRSSDDLQLTVMAHGGVTCTPDPATGKGTATDPAGAFTIDVTLTRFHRDNGESQLQVLVWDPQGGAIGVGGDWRLDILGRTVRSDGGVHGWVERDNSPRTVHFTTGSTDELTLSIPATARTVITVGACGSADPLLLHPNSSRGPTRDARPKPELVAPGVDIVAARAGTTDQLVSSSGTSMAAPHVTGAVALLLARRKRLGLQQLNAAQVRMALAQSVRGYSGRWQPGFGSGRLDVEALLNAFE